MGWNKVEFYERGKNAKAAYGNKEKQVILCFPSASNVLPMFSYFLGSKASKSTAVSQEDK